jgi:hypothetical protein
MPAWALEGGAATAGRDYFRTVVEHNSFTASSQLGFERLSFVQDSPHTLWVNMNETYLSTGGHFSIHCGQANVLNHLAASLITIVISVNSIGTATADC